MNTKFAIYIISGLLLCSIGVVFACQGKDKKEKVNVPVIKGIITIDKTEYNFGTISEEGGKVSTTFTIRNNMEEPILITAVRTSCGCTTPAWTREPIEVGKTGEIEVTFDPKNRIGSLNKTITIVTNGNPERIKVSIKGVVE